MPPAAEDESVEDESVEDESVEDSPAPEGHGSALSEAEARALAGELVDTYRERIAFYKERFAIREIAAGDLVDEELARRVRGRTPLDRLRELPPEEVGWPALLSAIEQDEAAALAEWETVKEEARMRLESGHEAAQAIHLREPWQKAQFLAVRQSFIEEWAPRGGVEMRLIDMLAQTYAAWLYWLDILHHRALNQKAEEERQRERFGRWIPPLVEETEAQEQAGKMADRFHRMFVRTLRALRDLRRYRPGITIQNQGQVNIAGNQQVNTTSESSSTS